MSEHVIVSGGSRGLGMHLVEALLEAGYRVSSFSRNPSPFTRSKEHDDRFWFTTADISDSAVLTQFTRAAKARFGEPFALINCAAVAIDGVLASMPPQQISDMLNINLNGALQLTRLVVRQMLPRRTGGVIINISSIIGMRGYNGLAAYAATKGGMDAMTRALARELGPRNIRVHSIAPGYLDTDMTHGLDDTQRGQIIRRTPLGRLGTPGDITGAALFLLSDAASFMTGQVLVIDGGISC